MSRRENELLAPMAGKVERRSATSQGHNPLARRRLSWTRSCPGLTPCGAWQPSWANSLIRTRHPVNPPSVRGGGGLRGRRACGGRQPPWLLSGEQAGRNGRQACALQQPGQEGGPVSTSERARGMARVSRGLLWWPGPRSVSWQEHSTAHLALTLLQGQNAALLGMGAAPVQAAGPRPRYSLRPGISGCSL